MTRPKNTTTSHVSSGTGNGTLKPSIPAELDVRPEIPPIDVNNMLHRQYE